MYAFEIILIFLRDTPKLFLLNMMEEKGTSLVVMYIFFVARRQRLRHAINFFDDVF